MAFGAVGLLAPQAGVLGDAESSQGMAKSFNSYKPSALGTQCKHKRTVFEEVVAAGFLF